MHAIFEPYSIGSLGLKNRIVRSATGESRATEDGVLKDEIYPIYEVLSAGGVGLIITGHMYVDQDWKCSEKQTGISGDHQISGLRRLASASQGSDTKVIAQINSAARPPHEMSEADIQDVVDRFVDAGKRAKEAGFDGIQIHAAHSYLVSGFLTPSENSRTDGYGGDATGRRRLLIEIAQRTRAALGPDYPIHCKLGAVDGRDDSLPIEESVQTAVALEEAGVEAIEISATFSGDHAKAASEDIETPEKEAYFASQAKAVKNAVDIPVILVGGLRSRAVMERVVEEGGCDLISLCRPFICEPDIVNKLTSGEVDRADCISCNNCYNPDGFRCARN